MFFGLTALLVSQLKLLIVNRINCSDFADAGIVFPDSCHPGYFPPDVGGFYACEEVSTCQADVSFIFYNNFYKKKKFNRMSTGGC